MTKETQQLLRELLFKAHYEVACRNNPSFTAFITSFDANGGDVAKSISAGLMTFGGKHAPIAATYNIINLIFSQDHASHAIEAMIQKGMKIAGWGSSFHKGGVDPAFVPLHEVLSTCGPFIEVAESVSKHITQLKGKPIVMNPSFYTCLTGMLLELPIHAIQNLLIQPRIMAWMDYVETNRN